MHDKKYWISHVREILNECGVSVWWDGCNGMSVKEVKEVISCLFRVERDRWFNNVHTKPKLRLYRLFKNEYKVESYTSTVNILSHRSLLARLRGGTAPLAIERGRYISVPAEERTRQNCNEEVEDDFLPHANVLKWKEIFSMSTLTRVALIFTFSLIETSASHHGNSSSKTAELIYYMFIARKCDPHSSIGYVR